MGELSRFVQAHDLYCAEQAQQKCAEAAAEGKARQAELSAAMDQADKDKKEKKKAIEKALAKKSKEGTGEIKTLEKQLTSCMQLDQAEKDAAQASLDAQIAQLEQLVEEVLRR